MIPADEQRVLSALHDIDAKLNNINSSIGCLTIIVFIVGIFIAASL
jgi:hypothetical protein